MKKRTNFYMFLYFVMGLLIAATSCDKKESENPQPPPPPIVGGGTVTDIDGNIYNIVTIGNQTWMAENLRTTRLNDSTPIDLVPDSKQWGAWASPAYCFYDNDEAKYKDPYGALYNWRAVDTKKLCPEGWHIPTAQEFDTLISFCGGKAIAGCKLREEGSAHWASSSQCPPPSSFAARAGGSRNYEISNNQFIGTYSDMRLHGAFWTADAHYPQPSQASAKLLFLFAFSQEANIVSWRWMVGLSCRCIKDK